MQTASQGPDGTYFIKPLVGWEDFVFEAQEREDRIRAAQERARARREAAATAGPLPASRATMKP